MTSGVRELPPPVEGFHAQFVGDDKVTLAWDPAGTSVNISQYEVYYKKLENNSSPASAFEHDLVLLSMN